MVWDKTWEKIYQEQEWGKYPSEALIRFVAKNFYKKQRNKVRILEIGCGPGANIWYLAREGFDTFGIDGSPCAIRRARSRLKEEGLRARLRVSDIEKLPYKESFFDAVIDSECLAHNPARAVVKILGEINRVLKEEGLLFSITFTNETSIGLSHQSISEFEFKDAADGPFSGKGFFRLTSDKDIDRLYGKELTVLTKDKLECTRDNRLWKTSEWIITCKKGGK